MPKGEKSLGGFKVVLAARTRFTFEDLGNYEFRMWAAYSQTSTSYCLALEATTSPTRLRFAPSTDSLCTGDRSIFRFSA